jgi:hypothetical protein
MRIGGSAGPHSPSHRTVVQVLWLGSRSRPHHPVSLVSGTDCPRCWVAEAEQYEQSTMTRSGIQLTARSNARRRFSSIQPATSANRCNLSSRSENPFSMASASTTSSSARVLEWPHTRGVASIPSKIPARKCVLPLDSFAAIASSTTVPAQEAASLAVRHSANQRPRFPSCASFAETLSRTASRALEGLSHSRGEDTTAWTKSLKRGDGTEDRKWVIAPYSVSEGRVIGASDRSTARKEGSTESTWSLAFDAWEAELRWLDEAAMSSPIQVTGGIRWNPNGLGSRQPRRAEREGSD